MISRGVKVNCKLVVMCLPRENLQITAIKHLCLAIKIESDPFSSQLHSYA